MHTYFGVGEASASDHDNDDGCHLDYFLMENYPIKSGNNCCISIKNMFQMSLVCILRLVGSITLFKINCRMT